MKLTRLAAALCAAAMLLCAGCSDAPAGESEDPAAQDFPVQVGDIRVDARPEKVICLSPSITEILYDLGLEDQLAGVGDACTWPEETALLTPVGTPFQLDLAKIRDIGPQLILTSVSPSEADLVTLQQMGITTVTIPAAQSLEELYDNYRQIALAMQGSYTGGQLGDGLVEEFSGRLEELSQAVAGAPEQKSAILLRQLDDTMATGDTLEGELMDAIGLVNAAESGSGWYYPMAQDEAFDPDIIYHHNAVTMTMMEQDTAYQGLTAVIHDSNLPLDMTVFENQGLRMLDLLEEMAAYAYPDLISAAEPEPEPDIATNETPAGTSDAA